MALCVEVISFIPRVRKELSESGADTNRLLHQRRYLLRQLHHVSEKIVKIVFVITLSNFD